MMDNNKYIINSNSIIEYHTTNDLNIKNNPYFGYIDIEVCNLYFKMFSNNDDFVAKHYYWNGANSYEEYSTFIWYKLAKNSMNVLDIGSYSGLYSIIASKGNPKTKVFAFEALNRVYSRLLINKIVNKCDNLSCHFNAVSEKKGYIKFNIFMKEYILTSGVSIELFKNKNIEDVRSVSSIDIDTFKLENTLKRIDVKKAEAKVLKGMEKVLEDDKPDILIEIFDSINISYIDKILKKNNYDIYLINDYKRTIERLDDIYQINHFRSMDELNARCSTKSIYEINSILEL